MSVHDRVPARLDRRPETASYRPPPIALVLGTGDIPSAIAHALFSRAWGVVMLRDAAAPVLRRGMAFDDALEGADAPLEGVSAIVAPSAEALARLAGAREAVVLANLDPAVVACACPGLAVALIDARMRKYATPADLRPLAGYAIGIGPGFVAGETVHCAIETLPGHEGGVITHGPTATPTGKAVPLGGAGAERFIYSGIAAAWQPMAPLGAWLDAGETIGMLGDGVVRAPISGCLRGLVRGAPGGVARGMKLAEIDPRPGAAWTGIPPRARRIARGVEAAVAAHLPLGLHRAA